MWVKYIDKNPIAEEFNQPTEAVGCGRRENIIVEEALKHTLCNGSTRVSKYGILHRYNE